MDAIPPSPRDGVDYRESTAVRSGTKSPSSETEDMTAALALVLDSEIPSTHQPAQIVMPKEVEFVVTEITAPEEAVDEGPEATYEGAGQHDAESSGNTQTALNPEAIEAREIEPAAELQEDEPPAKKPRTTCGICQMEVSKYKCPRCPLA